MCGWFNDAASCASERNRRRNAASSASAACSTLSATRRRSRVSSATYTRPLAPVPTGACRRYRSARTRPARSATPLPAIATTLVSGRRRSVAAPGTAITWLPTMATPPRRFKLTRLLFVGGGLLLAANLMIIAGSQHNDAAPQLPSEIQQLFPDPQQVIRPQETVGADL